MIAPDTMLEKEAAMDTKAFTEFEGLPISIHQAAPLPADEEARLAKLKKMSVLDTDAEQRFDDITQLVCSIFNVPIAIVSLVDRERQWFKSCQGLACNQTDRKSSFCAWTLVPKNPEVLVVPDATEDVRCLLGQHTHAHTHTSFNTICSAYTSRMHTQALLHCKVVNMQEVRQWSVSACKPALPDGSSGNHVGCLPFTLSSSITSARYETVSCPHPDCTAGFRTTPWC